MDASLIRRVVLDLNQDGRNVLLAEPIIEQNRNEHIDTTVVGADDASPSNEEAPEVVLVNSSNVVHFDEVIKPDVRLLERLS